jgi:hypothetical protein
MLTFDDLEFGPRPTIGGIIAKQSYANGYGVSVIQGPGSYGFGEGLYELAVLKGGGLCYDTPITDDVEGYLTPENVTNLMRQVQELPDAQ